MLKLPYAIERRYDIEEDMKLFNSPFLQIRVYLEELEPWFPVSPEFLNYALALVVYSVRYPAVFWNTNKPFAFFFSMQLMANAVQVRSFLLDEAGIFLLPSSLSHP